MTVLSSVAPAAGSAVGRGVAESLVLASMLLPGAMTIAVAFQSGGYGTAAAAVAAVEATVLLMLWLLLAERPFASVSRWFVVAIASLFGLAAWSALSAWWSVSPERAAPEFVRAQLYAATLAVFALMASTPRRARMLALGLAGACVIVCAAALASRTLPGVVDVPPGYPVERLAYPISYWNGLGLLAAIGIVLCLQFTAASGEPRWIARLAAAALPLLVATLYATQSRAATVAAVGGVVIYLALARPAGAAVAALAVLPASVGATIAVQLAGVPDAGATSAGSLAAAAIAVCAFGAAVARARLRPNLDTGWLPHAGGTTLVAIGVGAAAIVAATVVVAVVVGGDRGGSDDRPRAASGRLFSTSSSGRFQYWRSALATAADSPLNGSGAGTFDLEWVRNRETARLSARDGHSLYLETLSELGLVGFGFLALTLSAIVVGVVRRYRARAPDRSVWAALLASSVVWLAHAAVDWDWELPAISLWLFAVGGAALARPPARTVSARRSGLGRIAVWTILLASVAAAFYSGRIAIASSRLEAAVRAAEAGACPTAEARASTSLRWRDASEPYVVIAWCRRESDPDGATRAMSEAVRRDPEDWRLRYDLALLLALAGKDGAAEARRAAALNPLDPNVQRAVVALSTGTTEARRAFARNAQFQFR